MARKDKEKKKKEDDKSIYDYELKDVNKDGKKNFGDTWLGDALGFDGKLGVQGPGMKESMKGARRNMGGSDKKKKATRPKARPGSTTKPRARPEEEKTPPGPGPKRDRPAPKKQSGPPKKERLGLKDKKEESAPSKPVEKKSETTSPKRSPSVTRTTKERVEENKRKARRVTPGGALSGMARGGMAKNGNKDYKKSGMFYKSGSPKGYK